MFGIELTLGQKLQALFVVAVFGAAGYMFFRNTRPPVDMTINEFTQRHLVPLDPKMPISAKNPVDLAKSTLVTVFGCHDGKLEIEEFPAASGLKAEFRFVKDNHRTKFDIFQDPMAWVNAISDPYKRAIASAAYNAANRSSMQPAQLLRSVNLDDEQRKAEKDARDTMLNDITLMVEGSKTGNYHPDMYEKVLQALAAFRAKAGDPSKDPAAAVLAHKVLDSALAYQQKLESEKAAAIKKYMSVMDTLLKDDQKTKLADAYKQFSNRFTFGRRGRAG